MSGGKKAARTRTKTLLNELREFKRSSSKEEDLAKIVRMLKGSSVDFMDAIKITYPNTYSHMMQVIKKEKDFFNVKINRHPTLYHLFLNRDVKRCPECAKAVPTTSTYCKSCSPKTSEHKKAIEVAIEANGGTLMKRPKVRAKFLATMQSRYGVSWARQNEKLADKQRKTLRANYGVDNPLKTPQGIAGTLFSNNDPETLARNKAKMRQTMERRYGPNWRVDIGNRLIGSRYQHKEVTLKGKTFKCQGYEPTALKWLVEKGIKVSNLTANKSRTCTYLGKDGLTKDYVADIIVKTETGRWLVEVKCDFTTGLLNNPAAKDWWDTLKRKSKGVSQFGEDLHLILATSKKVILVVKNPHLYTRAQMSRLYSEAFAASKLTSRNVL